MNKMAKMPPGMESYRIIAEKAVGTIGLYLDGDIQVEDIGLAEDFPKEPGATQVIEGSKTIVCSLNEVDGGLLGAVSRFAGEDFGEITEADALDATGEMLNFISGAYAAEMSRNGKECELLPPTFGTLQQKYKAAPICRMNLRSGKRKLCFSIGVLD